MEHKILICDDELYILESVSYVMRNAGYTILTADNGADALRLAQTEHPALLILDVMLPRLSGFEVCAKLKGDAATGGIRIILLTARGQQDEEDEGFRCGADGYMTKPFSPRKLRQLVEEILEERS